MYRNIGKKIKTLVKVIVTIGLVIIGLATLVYSFKSDSDFLKSLNIALVIALAVWIGGFVLYGFGELVDNSTRIREMLEEDRKGK